MDNPIKMDDLGGKKLFSETPTYITHRWPTHFVETQQTSDPRHWKTLSATVMEV